MTTHFDNLDYFNKKRLLDNEVYAYLTKLKELKKEIPEVSSGLDYYKMWLSRYNKNKNSITAKSNVEDFTAYICEKMREYNKVIFYLLKDFDRLDEKNGILVLKIALDFVLDTHNIKTIRKIYNIKQKDLITALQATTISLKNYWG